MIVPIDKRKGGLRNFRSSSDKHEENRSSRQKEQESLASAYWSSLGKAVQKNSWRRVKPESNKFEKTSNIGFRGILSWFMPFLGYRRLTWREKLQRRIERLYGEVLSRFPAMAFFVLCCGVWAIACALDTCVEVVWWILTLPFKNLERKEIQVDAASGTNEEEGK